MRVTLKKFLPQSRSVMDQIFKALKMWKKIQKAHILFFPLYFLKLLEIIVKTNGMKNATQLVFRLKRKIIKTRHLVWWKKCQKTKFNLQRYYLCTQITFLINHLYVYKRKNKSLCLKSKIQNAASQFSLIVIILRMKNIKLCLKKIRKAAGPLTIADAMSEKAHIINK